MSIPHLEKGARVARPWIGWCIAAIPMALLSSLAQSLVLAGRISMAEKGQKMSAEGFWFGALYVGLSLFIPFIIAALFMPAKKFQNARSFFKITFWAALVTTIIGLVEACPTNEGSMETATLQEYRADGFSIRWPCVNPVVNQVASSGIMNRTYACDARSGTMQMRIISTGPSSTEFSGESARVLASSLFEKLFKQHTVRETNTVLQGNVKGVEYVATGQAAGNAANEARLRIFVHKNFVYQVFYAGNDTGGSKLKDSKLIFDTMKFL